MQSILVCIGANLTMYVCICFGITDTQIRRAADDGCSDLASLAARTGCGTGCGCCQQMASQLLTQPLQAADAPLQISVAA